MAVEAGLPALGVVLTTAAIDAINPCAIGVLILMISVMLGSGKSTGHMLFMGSLYVLAVFATYLAAGLGFQKRSLNGTKLRGGLRSHAVNPLDGSHLPYMTWWSGAFHHSTMALPTSLLKASRACLDSESC